MPLLENKKYVLCKIDGQEYCLINGQFDRFLASLGTTRAEYIERHEGVKCRCLYCGAFSKIQTGFIPRDTCGSHDCAKAARAAAIKSTPTEVRKQWNAAPTQRRKNDSLLAAKITEATRAGNLRVGDDGLTGYQRAKETRQKTLLDKYGNRHYANWEKTKQTWASKSDEDKNRYAIETSERLMAIPTEKKERINETIRNTMQERYGVSNGFALRKSNTGYSKIASSLFEAIDPGDAFYKPKSHEKTIDRLQPDFVVGNKIIEFFGNYWHRNPMLYDADSIVQQNGKSAVAIWENDRSRISRLVTAGYQVKIVWELDFKRHPEKIIEECRAWLSSI